MIKVEFGIVNKVTNKTRYYLSEINELDDVAAQFEEIVKKGIKNEDDTFFFGREKSDFSYHIEDVG